jgi:hypothetical protein
MKDTQTSFGTHFISTPTLFPLVCRFSEPKELQKNEVAVDRHDPTIDQFENNEAAFVESNLHAPNPGHDVIGPEFKAPSENESKARRPTSLDVEVNC